MSRWVVVATIKKKKNYFQIKISPKISGNNSNRRKKMRGIQKNKFRTAVEIAKGSKTMFLSKNCHFFWIFSKFDMILLIACTQRARIFEPFIRGTYNKKFFQSTMKSTQLISIPSSIYIAAFYILSSSPWQTCKEFSWHFRQRFNLTPNFLMDIKPLSFLGLSCFRKHRV